MSFYRTNVEPNNQVKSSLS